MPTSSPAAPAPADPRPNSDRSAAGQAWGPSVYRSLAVLTLLLAGVSVLIGADMTAIATQLWHSAQITLAAAILVFLLVR